METDGLDRRELAADPVNLGYSLVFWWLVYIATARHCQCRDEWESYSEKR